MRCFLAYISLFIMVFLISCDAKDNLATPDYGFKKIIGSTKFEGEFYPWDLIETSDKGFLVLSSSNTTALKSIHLFKTDENGDFEFEMADSSSFKNPLPKIIVSGGAYYLIAMEQVTLEAHLLRIDLNNRVLVDEKTYAGFLYPTAIGKTDNGYILQGFDRDAQRIRILSLATNFNENWRERYSVYEDPIQFNEHLLQTRPLPFFCGESSQFYFLGSMYNYTLNVLFVEKADGKLVKRITGFRYDAGISNMLNIRGDEFFISKYNLVGENSILPKFTLDQGSNATINSQNKEEIPEKIDLELPLRAKSILKKITLKDKPFIAHLTETKKQETLLNFYDFDGNLVLSKRFGGDVPYFAGNVITSSDGGLVVLSKTYIAGRIARIVLIKLNKEVVGEL